jgi:DNA modification methylase
VARALKAGKYAIFADCGLGKTLMQLETIERLILLYSNEGDTVLTPFMGIGSEVFQAVKMGRKGVGFELKESYYDLAKKNVAAAVSAKSQLSIV